jgi:hypothetical protein
MRLPSNFVPQITAPSSTRPPSASAASPAHPRVHLRLASPHLRHDPSLPPLLPPSSLLPPPSSERITPHAKSPRHRHRLRHAPELLQIATKSTPPPPPVCHHLASRWNCSVSSHPLGSTPSDYKADVVARRRTITIASSP